MANHEEGNWRWQTARLTGATLVAVAILLVLPFLLRPLLPDLRLLGLGLDAFLGGLVAPIAVFTLLFAYARRQRAVDDRHGLHDD